MYARMRKQMYAHYDVSCGHDEIPREYTMMIDSKVCAVTGGATWLKALSNPWQMDASAAHQETYTTIGYEHHGLQLQVKCEEHKLEAMLDAIEQGFKEASAAFPHLEIEWVCGGVHQVFAHNINVKGSK